MKHHGNGWQLTAAGGKALRHLPVTIIHPIRLKFRFPANASEEQAIPKLHVSHNVAC